MAKMQQNTAAHEPSRQTCGKEYNFLLRSLRIKDCFRFGDSETEHLSPSEMAPVDFGPLPSVNVVKGRAELLSDPVSIMRYIKQGLHQTPSNSAQAYKIFLENAGRRVKGKESCR